MYEPSSGALDTSGSYTPSFGCESVHPPPLLLPLPPAAMLNTRSGTGQGLGGGPGGERGQSSTFNVCGFMSDLSFGNVLFTNVGVIKSGV